ncbi:zinc-finger domain-containing protein [Phascolarctobacterium succinatutens]
MSDKFCPSTRCLLSQALYRTQTEKTAQAFCLRSCLFIRHTAFLH